MKINNQLPEPNINMEELENHIIMRIHNEFPDLAISRVFVEMVLEFENEYLEQVGIAIPMSYVYLYDNGDLFGVEDEMIGYDYERASINDLIEQEWCDENDSGRVFHVAEGIYLYVDGQFRAM